MIPQFFDPFSPWKLHVRYLTRRYYPELYRSLRFHGIFVISAGLTTYKREKYVNIYVHMYIYILYILLYISKYIYSFHVYKYIYVYLYTVYKQNMYIFTYLYIDMGVPRWEWALSPPPSAHSHLGTPI